jgi:hypothetical protein
MADLDHLTPGGDIVGFGTDGVYVASWSGHHLVWQGRVLSNEFSDNVGWRADRHPRFVADVDADGYDDIVGIGDAGIWVSRGSAGGFSPAALELAQFGYGGGWRADRHPRSLVDFDGDGDLDVVGFGNSDIFVATWDDASKTFIWHGKVGDGFGYSDSWDVAVHSRWLVDLDGDGDADLLAVGDRHGFVAYGDGNQLGATTTFVRDAYSVDTGFFTGEHPRLVGNVDDDPWPELVAIGHDAVYVSSP